MNDYKEQAEEKLSRLFMMTHDHAIKWLAETMESADNWERFHSGLIQSHNLGGVILRENEKLNEKNIGLERRLDSVAWYKDELFKTLQEVEKFTEQLEYNFPEVAQKLHEILGVVTKLGITSDTEGDEE